MNKIISNTVLTFTFLLLVVNPLMSQDKTKPSPLDFLKDIRMKTLNNMPDNFSGILFSSTITNKLATIPKDSYLDKNKKIFVGMQYSKKNGILIEVQNVDDLYRDLYRDLPRQYFAFDLVLSSQSNTSILDKYDISYEKSSQSVVILKLKLKMAENSLLLYINTINDQIIRVDYILGKDTLTSTIVTYNQFETANRKYLIPAKFITKIFNASREVLPEIMIIEDIKIISNR